MAREWKLISLQRDHTWLVRVESNELISALRANQRRVSRRYCCVERSECETMQTKESYRQCCRISEVICVSNCKIKSEQEVKANRGEVACVRNWRQLSVVALTTSAMISWGPVHFAALDRDPPICRCKLKVMIVSELKLTHCINSSRNVES